MRPRAQQLGVLGGVFILVAAGCSDPADSQVAGGNSGASGTVNGGASGSSAGKAGGSGAAGSAGTAQAGAGMSSGGSGAGTGGASGTGGNAAGGGGAGGTSQGGAGGANGGASAGVTNAGGASAGGTSAGGASAAGTSGIGGASGSGGGGGVPTGGAAGSQGGVGGDAGGATGGGGAAASYCPATAGTPCNIMPVGDSITEGCCTQPMGGYRIELFSQALTNDKNITFVGTLSNGPGNVDGQPFPPKHEGHGGWKISQIAGVIDSAINSSKPHIVLLKIGTNDINGNDNISNAPTRLANLIDQICEDAPNALLVVSAIIPTTNDGTNNNVRNYNTAIKEKAEAAAASGKHVLWVDNYEAFAENPSYKTAYMADGLHPNSAGHAVLGQSFYDVIESYLPAK